jgi:hypothetical protein
MNDRPRHLSRDELRGFLSFGGEEPDKKRVGFRLVGDLLDPEAITRATGLTPSLSHRKGEVRSPYSSGRTPPPWPTGVWMMHSEDGLPETGNSLEDHLTWLLDAIEPHAETLQRLAAEQHLTADFYCSYFMAQGNSGFALSARTVRRIAAIGADLGVDIYGENVEAELAAWIKPEAQ